MPGSTNALAAVQDDSSLYERNPGQGLLRLEKLMTLLRGPQGCPWDREQTIASLGPYLVEETYELLEAMGRDDDEHHREELGDVLLQVVFQSQIRREQGSFSLDDVAHGIADKLVRRHPHVFGETKVSGSSDVVRNWEAIKRTEGRANGRTPRPALSGIPEALPALLRAQRVQSKSAKAGFDWTELHQARAKVSEELAEVDAAVAEGDTEATAAELGDLLFAVVSLARFLGVDSETALRGATDRFSRRFTQLERTDQEHDVDLHALSVPELEARWRTIKAKESATDPPVTGTGTARVPGGVS